MASKMTEANIYLYSFSLDNVVETLRDSIISLISVAISIFMPIIVELYTDVV